MLETLAPLNEITELSRTDAPTWVIILTKFNVIFLGVLSLFVFVTGKVTKRHLLISSPLALTGVFLVDPLGAVLQLSNPQQLVVYPLIGVCSALITQSLIPRYRSFGRILMAVICFAVLVGSLLIHLATINIKMDSQARMLTEHNYMMADITFNRNPTAQDLFLGMCKTRNVYCRTESEVFIPKLSPFMDEEDVYDVLKSAGISDRLVDGGNRFVVFTNLDDLYGSEFQVASFSVDGIERTIVDFDNVNRFHNESKNIVYIWVGILSAFWIYGGLYIHYFHERKFRQKRSRSI